ncbi:MAG TPA: hypothetical protein VIL85_25680 [Thermomicrobiales bacterium]|jgi:hypothetical protein
MIQAVEREHWQLWQRRIRELLDLPVDAPLTKADLPRPWFLIPPGNELADDEADDLCAAVRRHLLCTGSAPSVSTIINRLKNLNSEDSLPLLYAMRHVARTDGSIGRYWPAFREQITGNGVSLRDVQFRLAPELAQLWLRLYVRSGGALYYPREGKRNIKWPLVHAGLLPQDEDALCHFGHSIISQSGPDRASAPLGADDLDQFLLLLTAWLDQSHYATVRLAQLLRKHDGTAEAVGEFAQRWLRSQWQDLAAGVTNTQSSRLLLRSPRLVYDDAENQLVLQLPGGRVPGKVAPSFIWDNQTCNLAARYLPAEKATEYDPYRIPLQRDSWEQGATLVADQITYPLAVPRPPTASGNASLVFDASNGQLTRGWRLGGEYFVLIHPGRSLTEADSRALFRHCTPLESPGWGWQNYRLFAVETIAPDTNSARGLEGIERLEKATERLGLPDFAHLWRPRLRLVGGDRLPSAGDVPTYSATDRPYVEIVGHWRQTLPLRVLNRATPDDALVTLPIPPSSGSPLFVEVWPHPVVTSGQAQRIAFNETARQDIIFADPPRSETPSRLALTLSIELGDTRDRREALSLNDLLHGRLVVEAWPHAQLRLALCGGDTQLTLPVEADATGCWQSRWGDLGVKLPSSGPLTATLSWRGLVRSALSFADQPFLTRADLRTDCVHIHGSYHVRVTGSVTNPGSLRTGWAILLGSRPWAGQIRRQSFTIERQGYFSADLAATAFYPRWAAVGPSVTLGQKQPWQPWQIVNVSDLPITTAPPSDEAHGNNWDEWLQLLPQLRACDLPQHLHELVHSSYIEHLISLLPKIASTEPQWITINNMGIAERLAANLRAGNHLDMILIGHRLYKPRLLTPSRPYLAPQSLAALADALEHGGDIRLLCARPSGDTWLSSVLSITVDRAKENCRLSIVAREPLAICKKCGLVLPQYEFDHHHPIAPGDSTCTGERATFTAYGKGQIVPAHLALPFVPDDPAMVAQSLLAECLRVAGELDAEPTPASAPWLRDLWLALAHDDPDASPPTAFSALRDAHRELFAYVAAGTASSRWPHERRARFVRTTARYYPALIVFYRWLRHELELIDAASHH